MEKGQNPGWKRSRLNVVEEGEELGGELMLSKSLPLIIEPQTPKEPMEFLSRSCSVSAEEISKALANNQLPFLPENHPHSSPLVPDPSSPPPHLVDKLANHGHHSRRLAGLGKWFHHHHKDSNRSTVKKKDRVRAENAHMHAALSIASLASALAAVAAADSTTSGSKMSRAVASATELLASHCIELAQQAGHDRVASAIRSAVDIRGPGDLMTLTAASATALRAESALRARLPRDAKKNATISPYDKGFGDANHLDPCSSEPEEQKFPCVGELMQHTSKGGLRWRQVSIYVNKKSQVMLKMKSKHVGGAFSKKDKCLIYEVCDQITAWPFIKDSDNLEAYFGLKTGQGFLEFKCKSKVHKQQWVDGIQNMLQQAGCFEDIENSLQSLQLK